VVKIGLIGGSRISSDCNNRAGRTGKRLLDRPRKTLSQEEHPGGEESKGEHAEAFQAAEWNLTVYVTPDAIKYPNMWLRAAVELRNPDTTPDTAVI
jgi:hypothetical protein